MSLIGIGSGVVYHQYFDKSLDKENQIVNKSKVIEKYFKSKDQICLILEMPHPNS